MSYVDGFLLAVPGEAKEAFLAHARAAAVVIKEHGALRVVECWGDDVPGGKVTDFRRAVQAEGGEVVVFSWIEWPSREVRDAGMKAMMEDPRMRGMPMPFDGRRMVMGGFRPVVEA